MRRTIGVFLDNILYIPIATIIREYVVLSFGFNSIDKPSAIVNNKYISALYGEFFTKESNVNFNKSNHSD